MGCDIHMYCEEFKSIDGVKHWVNCDHWRLNPYFNEAGLDGEMEYEVVHLCGERNYSMFTALCGVRDYHGKSPKISDPRGFPNDCSHKAMEEYERWGSDGHSHSYVTLREVRDFVKENRPMKFSGLVTPEQAQDLDENGILPTSWCQGSSNQSLVHRQWEDNTFQPLQALYEIMAHRFKPYRKPDDIDDEILDDFRIVFFFDN